MPYRYFIFANPNGKNVTPDKIQKLQHIFSQGQGEFVVTENLSHLEKMVQERRSAALAKPEKTIVGIVGGDGTVMRTRTLVEQLWGYRPQYAFFPLGTMNNIQRTLGLNGKDAAYQLAQHLVNTANSNTVEKYTVSFPSLDVNGKKGFNIGFGLIPKLLWIYYGHSAKQYRELEEALQHSPPKEYQAKYTEITQKQETDLFDLLSKERGLWGAVKTTLRLMNGLRNNTDERYLLHKPLSGPIRFNGKPQHFPKAPLGIYISCYEEVNLGLGRFNPKPTREAGKEEGKFQTIVPYGNPFLIIPQLPKLMMGEKLSKVIYEQLSSLELPSEKFAQVDGELILENGFMVRYDGKRKIMTLPAT
ncbi:MAG TPA: diacylglycerol kinase family protein [Candidatus Nanoarchaeia archaeon]|nr:diacylglycerol kinase family protein [Candidatus Nanoarchaeia archaeon]